VAVLGTYYVMDYPGVVGDGVHDDTAGIQSAVNAAASAGGGIVVFPAKTFVISDWVTIGGDNVVLLGAGRGTVLQQAGTSWIQDGMLYAQNRTGLVVADMQLFGNGVPNATTINTGLLSCLACRDVTISRVRFYNLQGPGVYCDTLSGVACEDVSIDHCTFDTSGQSRTTALFMPAIFGSSGQNVGLRYRVTNCTFLTLHFHGVWLQANESIVSGCSFQSVGESRVVNAGTGNRIVDNTDRDGFCVSESGWFLESYPTDVVATGNRIYNAGQSGVHFGANQGNCAGFFVGGDRIVVANNEMYDCYGGGIWLAAANALGFNTGHGSSISGNVVANCGYADSTIGGITTAWLGGDTMTNVALTGNVCYGNAPYDMRIGAPADRVSITTRGNTAWPDVITVTNPSFSSTAFAVVESVPVGANAIWFYGGFRCRMRGQLALASSTAAFTVLFGGNVRLFVYGTYASGDTITYNVAGSGVTHTVTAAEAAAGPTAVAAGVATTISGSTLVSAAAVTDPVTYSAQPAGQVNVSARTAALALASNVSNFVTVVSASGHAAVSSSNLLVLFVHYVTPAPPQNGLYVIDVGASANGADYQIFGDATVTLGLAAVSATSTGVVGIDTEVAQTLGLYAQLGSGSDAITTNSMKYERL
jgi:Pectate lyase superfamily protein